MLYERMRALLAGFIRYTHGQITAGNYCRASRREQPPHLTATPWLLFEGIKSNLSNSHTTCWEGLTHSHQAAIHGASPCSSPSHAAPRADTGPATSHSQKETKAAPKGSNPLVFLKPPLHMCFTIQGRGGREPLSCSTHGSPTAFSNFTAAPL